MKIIDFRCRPSTPEYLAVISGVVGTSVRTRLDLPAPKAQTPDEWLDAIGREGVEIAVFTGRQSRGTETFDVDNDYVARIATAYPGTVVGFAGIDPMRGMESVRAVEHCVRTLGLKGISLDPFGSGVAANDRRLYPVYAKCAELDVPVVVTCGPLPFPGVRLSHGDVRAIDDVACDFPELTIVINHCGWPWVAETVAIAFRHDNVFINMSLYAHLPGSEVFADAANTIIPDRLLFASGFPVSPISTAVERLERLPFTPEALEGVLYGNAHRLLSRFGLIPAAGPAKARAAG